MAVIINQINVNSNILDAQEQNLVTSGELTRYFGLPEDFVQLYVYNNDGTVLIESIPNFTKYSITENKVVNFDPESDITSLGYELGNYQLYYNFLRPIITADNTLNLFIQNISQNRTELIIAPTSNENDFYFDNALNYIDEINNRNYFIEFYLDLGNNNLVTATSILAQKDIYGNATFTVKLLDPLPSNITSNSPLNIVEKIVNTQAFQALLTTTPSTPVLPSLRQANFSLNVDDQRIGSSDYYNFNQLTALTGSNNPQLQNLLGFISSSNPTINVDYTDYSNFTHFGSQTQRLSTFKTKVQKLELYNSYLPSSSLDNVVYQNKINEIIEGFDGYETYLYFESTSFAWPKSNTQPPFNLYSSTSPQSILWYNSNYTSASYYDEFNNNNLVYGLPIYIQERDDFEYLKPFIHSMGQMFDDIWIYIRAITDIWKAKNSLMDGISKDLVGDALQSLGISLYTDGDQDDLATYLYGVNQSGSYTFMPQPWQTAVTASNPTLSGQDEAKSVFKRLYANLPTLLKSKGTTKFVNYLTTLYGIPDTVLVPLEFGGVDKDSNTIEYSYPKFTYALSSSKTTYTQLSLPDSTTQQIQTLEFRFKPYPSASLYATQSLFSNFPTGSSKRPNSIIILNGNQSGSYQYGTLSFYSNDSGLALYNTPLQVTLPFYVTGSDGDYNWWNVVLERNSTTTRLYVKSELGGEIGHQSSSFTSTPVNSRFIETGSNTYLGTIPPNITASLINAPFYNFGSGEYYGQFQELKAYNNFISESVINIHTLNPESYVGNNSSSAYNDLLFRFPLGNDLQISGSRITGSQPTLRSDIILNLTGSNYISFTEMYYSQPAIGGYSVPVTNKIRIVSESLASNILQFNKSVVYPSTSSRTFDVQTAQAGFSPQDQINNDIIAHLGNTYNLDDIIGDPSTLTESSYTALTKLQENYFTKYNTAYNYKDFLILMETFHKSLFRYLNDFTPARTVMSSGIIIIPHIHERNKVARYEPSVSTGSVYYGETTMVSISGSNPGNYCCSRNLSYNESFYTGDISGSYIDVNDTYEQHNPFLNNPVTINRQFFNQQYSGWDALDNNVSSSLVSQFKKKLLPSIKTQNTDCVCVRYKVNPVDNSSVTILNYVDCDGTASSGTFTFVNSFGNVDEWNTLIACKDSVTKASGNNYDINFGGFIKIPPPYNVALKSGSIEFQDTLLTETSFQRSRIDGVKSTALSWNQLTTNTNSSSSFINVEYTTPYMIFYDWTSNTLAERQGSNNFHIRYLIDETGKIFKPESSGSEYYSILEQGFGAYTNVEYTIYNANYYEQSAKSTTVHRPLKTYSTIIYSDTGSWDDNYLHSGYFTTMSFNTPNGYLISPDFSVGLTTAYIPNNFEGIKFNQVIKDYAGGWNQSTYIYTANGTTQTNVNITASIIFTNNSGNTIDNINIALYKNNIQIGSNTISTLPYPFTTASYIRQSISYNDGDTFYVTYNCSDPDRSALYIDYNSSFQINSSNSSRTYPYATASYWTSSYNSNVITASDSLTYFNSLGYVQDVPYISGFSDPLPFTIKTNDEIRFGGQESQIYTVLSSSYESSSKLCLHLDRTPQGQNLDYFAIRRLIDDPGFIMLNTQDSQGPGFILPKFPTPTLKKNFSNIVQDLASKNLLT